jgi:hypothetical protein
MLIHKLWQVARDQYDHRNEVLHESENFVSLADAQKVTSCMEEELATRIQGTLHRDKHLFQELRVANALLYCGQSRRKMNGWEQWRKQVRLIL